MYFEKYIDVEIFKVDVKNSVSNGHGAFLEFKIYGSFNIEEINLSDCFNPTANGIIEINYNAVVNIINSNFSNTITSTATIKANKNNEIKIDNCSFFNVLA